MAVHKPLVMIGGITRQLPAGDQISGASDGGGDALHLPVVKHTGAIVRVSLTASTPHSLSVVKADGSAVLIPVGAA